MDCLQKRGIRMSQCRISAWKPGPSRAGLYRHYESTGQIFQEIITYLQAGQKDEFAGKIKAKAPAAGILEEVLCRYEEEMMDSSSSLSLAIYEFFSNPLSAGCSHSIFQQYLASKKMWVELIEYGIGTGEFRPVEPEAVYDVIVFSYQGVRMYSRLMPVDRAITRRITGQIKKMLLKAEEKEEGA